VGMMFVRSSTHFLHYTRHNKVKGIILVSECCLSLDYVFRHDSVSHKVVGKKLLFLVGAVYIL
jgi:hypothetical protein